MTLTTASLPSQLLSTPQKYKLFLTLIQINRFFCIKTSLPHHTSAITFRISLDPHFHNSCEARPPPSAISLRSSLFPLTSYFIHQPSSISHLLSQPSITSSLIHQPSFFHLTSSILLHKTHQPSAIIHQPSIIFHLTSSISHHPSDIKHQPSPSSLRSLSSNFMRFLAHLNHHYPFHMLSNI